MALLLSLIIVLVLYNFTGNVKQRINTAIYEVKNYQWNILSPTNGFNERVGFVRIGYHLFTIRPLTGWQNFDISIHQDDPEIANFVSVETRHGVKVSGFHNQFIDDMVKYGIFGLFSSLSVFLLPLLFFLYCYLCRGDIKANESDSNDNGPKEPEPNSLYKCELQEEIKEENSKKKAKSSNDESLNLTQFSELRGCRNLEEYYRKLREKARAEKAQADKVGEKRARGGTRKPIRKTRKTRNRRRMVTKRRKVRRNIQKLKKN
jgi:hypothetical protein